MPNPQRTLAVSSPTREGAAAALNRYFYSTQYTITDAGVVHATRGLLPQWEVEERGGRVRVYSVPINIT